MAHTRMRAKQDQNWCDKVMGQMYEKEAEQQDRKKWKLKTVKITWKSQMTLDCQHRSEAAYTDL